MSRGRRQLHRGEQVLDREGPAAQGIPFEVAEPQEVECLSGAGPEVEVVERALDSRGLPPHRTIPPAVGGVDTVAPRLRETSGIAGAMSHPSP